MKVLVIEPCFVNFGGYFRSYNLSLALSKKGVKVNMLVSSRGNSLWIKKTKINDNFYQYELPRFNIHPYLNGRLLRAVSGFVFGLFKNYDIIHACVPTQLESNIPAFFLKLLGKKVVIDWDDYWIGSPLFKKENLIKKYVRYCETKTPKFFENIVVVSDFLEEKAKKWGAKRTIKIINGVNTDQFFIHNKEEGRKKIGLNPNGKYLVTFGNNFSYGRIFLLFKTFEYIYNIDPEVKLIFNLDPCEMMKQFGVKDEINEKCLDNIINVGNIEQEDLGYYLGACNATIFLQKDTEDEIACFPIRIGSYLNGESVVIMNDIGSETGNTLKKFGCAIIEKDIKILAQRTIEFLNNPNFQKEIKEKVLKAKEDLSWNNLVVNLIKYYKSIK